MSSPIPPGRTNPRHKCATKHVDDSSNWNGMRNNRYANVISKLVQRLKVRVMCTKEVWVSCTKQDPKWPGIGQRRFRHDLNDRSSARHERYNDTM